MTETTWRTGMTRKTGQLGGLGQLGWPKWLGWLGRTGRPGQLGRQIWLGWLEWTIWPGWLGWPEWLEWPGLMGRPGSLEWPAGMTGMTGMTKIKHVAIALGNVWATFAVGSSFLRFSQPRTTFAILSNFWAKLGLEYISNSKNWTMTQRTSSYANFSEFLSTEK